MKKQIIIICVVYFLSTTLAEEVCKCPLSYAPVCGSDIESYDNDCMFKCAQKSKGDLKLLHEGECTDEELDRAKEATTASPVVTPPRPKCACPRIYRPVCGSDHNTYNNPCMLKCETKRNPKLKQLSEGPCRETRDLNCKCSKIMKPVCGTNKQTYLNECLLKCDAAGKGLAIEVAHYGKCSTSRNTLCKCSKIYAPVCGSDNRTYSNECQLRCILKNQPGLKIKKAGPCTA